jgi:hypothetical protein
MVRFIYLCMGIFGVSGERENLSVTVSDATEAEKPLSFQEIYALAEQSREEKGPAYLNDMAPAAGNETAPDSFSSGFSGNEDSALADTPAEPEPETDNPAQDN